MSHLLPGVPDSQQLNETDDLTRVLTVNATPIVIKRYTPSPSESGTILLRYNACDTNMLTANRYKLVRYKKTAAGVLTVANVTSLYSNNDTGFNTVDFTVTSSNGDVTITVTGTANQVIHTLRTEKTNSINDDTI